MLWQKNSQPPQELECAVTASDAMLLRLCSFGRSVYDSIVIKMVVMVMSVGKLLM